MNPLNTFQFVKIDCLRIIRKDKYSGLAVYLLGLPFIPYILLNFISQSDSILGISILAICSINVLYSPNQFEWGSEYIEFYISKPGALLKNIWGKVLLLQSYNFIAFLIILPLCIFNLDKSRCSLLLSIFFYVSGVVSPLSILVTGYRFANRFKMLNNKQRSNNTFIINLLFIILAFIPLIWLIVIFSARNGILLIITSFLFIVGESFCSKICNIISAQIKRF